MAAVPVSLMHHTGLQIPQMAATAPGGQMMLPVSTMLSMNAVPLTTSTMASMMNGGYHQPQFQPTAAELSNGCAQDLGRIDAASPSRSLSSASPPAMASGGNPGTPTPPNEPLPEEKNPEYLKELQAERDSLEAVLVTNNANTTAEEEENKTNHAIKLLEQEIARVQSGRPGSGNGSSSGYREPIKYVDVYRERPIRLTVRVLVPVREHPKFNFVGKLLGPKGNSMKRLQEETMTKMAVLGRGSMRDKQKEEELRASNDPKYQHLREELHVEITAFAPPAEAHARIAYALTEVRKYLIPDSNDDIRQEQMREMEILAANGDTIGAAAAAAAAGITLTGLPTTDPTKRPAVSATPAGMMTATAAPNLAMIHPAFRPSLALATPQSIQNQAAAAAAVFRGMSPTAAAATTGVPTTGTPVGMPAMSAATLQQAAVAMRSQQNGLMAAAQAATQGSPYIAAAPMIRKLVSSPVTTVVSQAQALQPQQHQQQQKLLTEEMMLEAAAVSQAPSDIGREDGTDGDAWQGLKAPTVHHDQRSKFRQQTAPYIRPN